MNAQQRENLAAHLEAVGFPNAATVVRNQDQPAVDDDNPQRPSHRDFEREEAAR